MNLSHLDQSVAPHTRLPAVGEIVQIGLPDSVRVAPSYRNTFGVRARLFRKIGRYGALQRARGDVRA